MARSYYKSIAKAAKNALLDAGFYSPAVINVPEADFRRGVMSTFVEAVAIGVTASSIKVNIVVTIRIYVNYRTTVLSIRQM